MTPRSLLAAFSAFLLSGTIVQASPVTQAVRSAKKISVSAKTVGQDSRDMALSSLYNRLFQLQDLRRDNELKIDEAELFVGDVLQEYKKLDRWIDTVEELKAVASNPEHNRYPNITEKTKLALLAQVSKQVRAQVLAGLDIKRIDRDIAKVERLIEAHLNRTP